MDDVEAKRDLKAVHRAVFFELLEHGVVDFRFIGLLVDKGEVAPRGGGMQDLRKS